MSHWWSYYILQRYHFINPNLTRAFGDSHNKVISFSLKGCQKQISLSPKRFMNSEWHQLPHQGNSHACEPETGMRSGIRLWLVAIMWRAVVAEHRDSAGIYLRCRHSSASCRVPASPAVLCHRWRHCPLCSVTVPAAMAGQWQAETLGGDTGSPSSRRVARRTNKACWWYLLTVFFHHSEMKIFTATISDVYYHCLFFSMKR